ncbi:VWA domain-containing protein [Vibrio mexicanus]|uniref:VWA domain-containing protein n=1 Tax=Vibrio mexicanus TaxID=1004326 RepID=UPI00069928DB|nr:VWA domain-containing protein [Vibrio mexicanus]
MSVEDAIGFINELSAGGYTDYDDAISQAQSSWNSAGKLPESGNPTNVTYFLSDGVPQGEDNDDDVTINQTEQNAWTAHLDNKGITALAYGMGEGAVASHLDQIAFDGHGSDPQLQDTTAVMVPDITQLPPVLLQSIIEPAVGNLLENLEGADGGHVSQITYGDVTFNFDGEKVTELNSVGGVTHQFSKEGNILSIYIDSKHSLVVDLDDGSYKFFGAAGQDPIDVDFGYSITDGDGDSSSSTMEFDIAALPELPDGGGDNGGGNSDGLPTADGFALPSEHSVVRVNFAPHARDDEDDAPEAIDKHTSVRIESLPTKGDLYYKDPENGTSLKSPKRC